MPTSIGQAVRTKASRRAGTLVALLVTAAFRVTISKVS